MDTVTVVMIIGACVAGFVQGLSGFAFSLVALTFWAWAIPPQVAGPLAVFGSLLGQLIAIDKMRKGFELKKAAPLILGGAVGVPLGTALLPHIDQATFKAAVGILLLAWSPAMLFVARFPRVDRVGPWADGAVGLSGGVLGGLAGMTGAIPALWCILRAWQRDTQRAVLQAFNIAMHVMTLTAYFASGLLNAEAVRLFPILAVAVVVPVLLGARLYHAINDLTFRRIVLVLLVVSGVVLLTSAIRTWTA
jgi:uncharacterized membrane protein YfcA